MMMPMMSKFFMHMHIHKGYEDGCDKDDVHVHEPDDGDGSGASNSTQWT